jgi:hypothetical protein
VVAEAAAGDQPDLRGDLFYAGVTELVSDRGFDSGALVADRAGELDERLETAARRPLQPGVQDTGERQTVTEQ